jgi:hypothetical protein
MKINEVIEVDPLKQVFDTLVNSELSQEVYTRRYEIRKVSNDFTLPPNQLYDRAEISEILKWLHYSVDCLNQTSAKPEQSIQMINEMIDYFERTF